MAEQQNSEGNSFAWLADAPLMIDGKQVNAFYDAVLRPEGTEGKTTVEVSDESDYKVGAEGSLEGTAKGGWLVKLLVGLDAEAKASAKLTGEAGKTTGNKRTVELTAIDTPQRQLAHLALAYHDSFPDRLLLMQASDLVAEEWRSPSVIDVAPRPMLMLELPSLEEAAANNLPQTRLIPTAAEFDNGKVVLLYSQIVGKDGSKPPEYPEAAPNEPYNALIARRKEYWKWFDTNFSATKSMLLIEEAASDKGLIRWIDFRLPISNEGDTLHLHICPRGQYDIGDLAYALVKRGNKHGLRLVGTLKSEPDLNVLAVFER